MNFNFDGFEFTGLIAPGSVVVIAVALLFPHVVRIGDPTVTIAVAIVVAYIVGHLVSAIGNLAELALQKMRPTGPASLSVGEWTGRYISHDQEPRLHSSVRVKLHRSDFSDEADAEERRTILKQMFLAVVASGHGQRVDTFNGLFNLSRGLAVSFFIAGILGVVSAHYQAVLWSALAIGLALFRAWKFRDAYSRELFQQFLLLEL